MQDKRILEETLCLGTGSSRSAKEIDSTIVASSCLRARARATSAPTAAGTAPSTTARRPPRRWRTMDQGREWPSSSTPVPGSSAPSTGRRRSRALGRARLFTREFGAAGRLARMPVPLKTATAELMRIDWASVGGICRRVYDEPDAEAGDASTGLVRIGIDETSYKKGHKYMTGRARPRRQPAWSGARRGTGRPCSKPLLRAALRGSEASTWVVTADGARWIAELAESYCPNAGGSWTPSRRAG